MDTTRFLDDLVRIPEALLALADELDRGIPELDALPLEGITRVLVIGMGSSYSAADTLAREPARRA